MSQRQLATLLLTALLILACLNSIKALQHSDKEKEIAGLPVEVLSEFRSRMGPTWFVNVYLPREYYSRGNIILIWRHFCEKYPVKEEKLDVRVYTEKPGSNNTSSFNSKSRGADAMFVRMGYGAAAGGGDNELLIYRPDLDKPDETKREVLAGRDPIP